MLAKTPNNRKFDFDIGHIIKSPCRECDLKNRLPDCSESCQVLDRIQTILRGGVSCSNDFHPTEGYSLSKRDS